MLTKLTFKAIVKHNAEDPKGTGRGAYEFLFSCYTPEQLEQFNTDLAYSEQQGWINVNASKSSWDPVTREFSHEFTGPNVEAFFEYFVLQKGNLEPVMKFFKKKKDQVQFIRTVAE